MDRAEELRRVSEPTGKAIEVYQLRIWIRKISPQIWRRLQVRSDSTIAELHDIFQIAFGWADDHLHQFLIRGKPYGIGRIGGIIFDDNARQIQLRDFHFRCKETWAYEYDLTDWWQHEIRLEQILPLDPKKRYPICTAGKRRGPIEDCGGPWAFMELQDKYPQWEVMPQFAQFLLDHRDDLDDYREELRQLAYWIVREDFDRQAVNRRLAENNAACTGEKGDSGAYPSTSYH
jgi:Plasmid pRiA4b ORF-3-like protein